MISTMKKRRSNRPRMGTSRGNDEHFSSSNNSRDDDLYLEEEEDMANCLILLAQGRHHDQQLPPLTAVVNKELYACKTCNRIFPSFQALGGHRASHNRLIKTSSSPPILPSSSENQDDLTTLSLQIHYPMVSNKNKMHECSICGAEFTSGQALGGHMRRHRPLPPTSSDGGPEESPSQETKKARNLMSFDLNLPAEEERRESSFPAAFAASKERVIVFSNSPLVDCHY